MTAGDCLPIHGQQPMIDGYREADAPGTQADHARFTYGIHHTHVRKFSRD